MVTDMVSIPKSDTTFWHMMDEIHGSLLGVECLGPILLKDRLKDCLKPDRKLILSET